MSPCLLELIEAASAVLDQSNTELLPIEICLKLENTQSDGKINHSKCIVTYRFAKWSNHDVYLVTNSPFSQDSIAGD